MSIACSGKGARDRFHRAAIKNYRVTVRVTFDDGWYRFPDIVDRDLEAIGHGGGDGDVGLGGGGVASVNV